ncbi:MAG: single-stranded DNA-binding protein [Bacteroidetes bacterium]|nr:single-stranded DNA-binding protein [Bacteroidota bacterium]MBK8657941.1 single-stranded DNA-binding protein [Bacteroidota bacterium]
MVNKVFLIGRLGKDPVIKHFSNDNAIAEATLATDDSYKDKQGNKVEQTDWHNLKFPYRSQAQVVEKYLKKGSLLHVEGKIKTRSYDDKDGNKRYITEIVVENFKMLGGKGESGGSSSYSDSSSSSAASEEAAMNESMNNDLPF